MEIILGFLFLGLAMLALCYIVYIAIRIRCPYPNCGSKKVVYLHFRKAYSCRECHRVFE